MTLEAIEKLREWRKHNTWGDDCIHLIAMQSEVETKEFDEIVETIEREIDEQYMKLPVDADGMPIRVGEEVKFIDAETDETLIVMSLVDEKSFRFKGSSIPALGIDVRHVKSRTIEDVLRDLLNDHFKWDKRDGEYEVAYETYNDKKIVQYAEEIRSLQRKKEIKKC